MTAASFSVVLFLPLLANAAPLPCDALAKFMFNDAAITLAQSVPAGEFAAPRRLPARTWRSFGQGANRGAQRTPRVLPGRGNSEAHSGFRHQSRDLDARDELESEI